MRTCPRLVAVSLICVALSGCTALSRRMCDAAMDDPERLLVFANQAMEKGNLDLAYRYAGTIHALHPGSSQDREAFPLAARLFRYLYQKRRLEFDSIWVASEPRFMMSWLAQFFEDGREFPQENVDLLFVGMNAGLFREFQSYAQIHPRLSRWRITARDDNGIVQKVDGAPFEGPRG